MGHLGLGVRNTRGKGCVSLSLRTWIITVNPGGTSQAGLRETADHAGDVRLGNPLETRMITGNPGGAS